MIIMRKDKNIIQEDVNKLVERALKISLKMLGDRRWAYVHCLNHLPSFFLSKMNQLLERENDLRLLEVLLCILHHGLTF